MIHVETLKQEEELHVIISNLDPADSKIIDIENQIRKQLEKDWGKGTRHSRFKYG
jgi:hypothetical protein